MYNTIELGPVPANEECTQVSQKIDYLPQMKSEVSRYCSGISKAFPDADVRAKSFPHEFGNYYEVILRFNEEDENEVGYAYYIESNLPQTWEELERMEKNPITLTQYIQQIKEEESASVYY